MSKTNIKLMIEETYPGNYIPHNFHKGDKVSRKSSFPPTSQYHDEFYSIW